MELKELKFSTNINCDGCIAKVKPHFDKNEGIVDWNVDIADKNKILTVKTEKMSGKQVSDFVESINYKAKLIS